MLKLPINLCLITRMVADLDLNNKKILTTIQDVSDQVEIQELFFQKQFQKLSQNFVEQKLKILINDNTPESNLKIIKRNIDPNVCAKISTFSADGKYLSMGSEDNTCKIWNVEKGFQLINTIQGHTDYINSVAFSVDQNGFELLNTIQGHTNSINSVAFSSDGKNLATASQDKTCKIWNAEKGFEVINRIQGDIYQIEDAENNIQEWQSIERMFGGEILFHNYMNYEINNKLEQFFTNTTRDTHFIAKETEIVIYGCGNEVHDQGDDLELYSQYFQFQQDSLAVGFNVKQPPICKYCQQKIYDLVENKNLKVLTLAFLSSMPRLFMEKLYQVIKGNEGIQKLNIRWADAALLDEKMIEFIGQAQRKEINFKLDAARIDDSRGEIVLKQLLQNKQMENLHLSGNMLGDKSLIQIEKILETHSKQLKNISFNLNNNEINDNNSNDENLYTFCDNMKFDPKKLTELDLSFAQNEFNNDGVIYLSKKISEFSELQNLSINFRSNSISDEGLSVLFENLSKLQQLQKLQLNISGLYEDVELENIELLLREARNLMQLTINLQDNNIKQKGIQMLAMGIKQNKTISDLSLNFFYGKLENLDHLLITIIDEILNNQNSFGELNIIANSYSEEKEKKLYYLLSLICLTNFEQIIKLIQLKKILHLEFNNKYLLDLIE
ncbi:hypothetical protein ABPG73_008333 [Tetrahymena malaccensis]